MTDDVQDIEHVEGIDNYPVVLAEPKPEWTDDDAEEARAFGWKSPDEWQGDVPAGYIDDPRRYLERAENFRPFKALKQRLEQAETSHAERIRKLEAVSDQAIKAQRAQYERDLQTIQAQKRAAAEVADVEQYDALDRQERAMTPPAAPQNGPDPTIAREYAKTENGAWVNNPMLRKQGRELIDAAIESGMNWQTPQEQIEYAEQEIRKMYPSYFPAKETQTTTTTAPTTQRVDGGGLAGGAAKGGAFTKLPPEAKAAFKRFAADGLFKDTEEDRKRYADDYNAA